MLVSPHLKSVLKTYQHSATKSLHGPGKLPNLPSANGNVQFLSHKCAPSSEANVIQQPQAPLRVHQVPILTAADQNYALDETQLENETISCFIVGGERRLCLPQVLQSVLRDFTLGQINHQCDNLLIYCSRCSPEQLNVLKTHCVLPSSAFSCGLITQTDAHRLCSALLHNDSSGKQHHQHRRRRRCLTNGISIRVKHKCFGRARGTLWYTMYTSKEEKCIECMDCSSWYNPQQFVCHVCVDDCRENRTVHWGFDSNEWRRYLLVDTELADAESKRSDDENGTPELGTSDMHRILNHMEGMFKGVLDFKSIDSLKFASNFASHKYEKGEHTVDPRYEKIPLSSIKSEWNMSLKRKLLQHDLHNQEQQKLFVDKKKIKLENDPGGGSPLSVSELNGKKMEVANTLRSPENAISTIYSQFMHQSVTNLQKINHEKSTKEQQIRANIRAANMDLQLTHSNNVNAHEDSLDRFVSKKHRFFRHLKEFRDDSLRNGDCTNSSEQDDDRCASSEKSTTCTSSRVIEATTISVTTKADHVAENLHKTDQPPDICAEPPEGKSGDDTLPALAENDGKLNKTVEVQVKSPDSTSLSLNGVSDEICNRIHVSQEHGALVERLSLLLSDNKQKDEILSMFHALLGANALLRDKLQKDSEMISASCDVGGGERDEKTCATPDEVRDIADSKLDDECDAGVALPPPSAVLEQQCSDKIEQPSEYVVDDDDNQSKHNDDKQ